MPSQFDALFSSFAQSKGLQLEQAAVGVEFSTERHSLTVTAHPVVEDLLVVEVAIADPRVRATEMSQAALLMLLQINDAARLEHDWTISVGAEGVVRLGCLRRIAETDLSTLEALMGEGLERAESLADLVRSLAPANGGSPSAPPGGAFLRA
ncbi:MAG: hypothetical protein ACKODB_08010 [Betaproteobacteria bacterium]